MPGYSIIKKVKKGELRPISEFGITPESTRLGGTLGNGLIGGGGAFKKGVKFGLKAIKLIRKKLKENKK
jgi:hypothetical protein